MICNDYFIKIWDSERKCDGFYRIVGRGQPFPTGGPVKTMELAATHEGQTRLGVEVFELPDDLRRRESLSVDGRGRLQLSGEAALQLKRRKALNADRGKFIIADPPCSKGERRFRVAFGIDAEGWLTVSVTDRHPESQSKLLMENEARPLPATELRLAKLDGKPLAMA